jgi:hypothetical protein
MANDHRRDPQIQIDLLRKQEQQSDRHHRSLLNSLLFVIIGLCILAMTTKRTSSCYLSINAVMLLANDVGPGIGARPRVCVHSRVGKSIASGCIKVSSTGSSGTSILLSPFIPSTSMGPFGFPT